MKRLLIIICLCPILAFGQFSGAKKLLLQQAGCKYGDLSNYTNYGATWYASGFGNCNEVTITDLITARVFLDRKRTCTVATGGYGPSWYYTLSIGSYILNGSYQPTICDDVIQYQDRWTVLTPDGDTFTPIGTIPIVHIENGVITYIEYY